MTQDRRRRVPPSFTARGRLLVALAAGLACYLMLGLPPAADRLVSAPLRAALAWDAVVSTYLVLAAVMMWRHDRARIRARAKAIDISLPEIVAVVVLAAAFSLFAVVRVLAEGRDPEAPHRLAHIAIGGATVFLSWVTLHVIYALHYAHIYYDSAGHDSGDGVLGGLDFPGEREPDYWDFVYFAFVIGMTCQVSDVQVTARKLRHLVTAQGIIAFFYNTTVVALAVSIAANLI